MVLGNAFFCLFFECRRTGLTASAGEFCIKVREMELIVERNFVAVSVRNRAEQVRSILHPLIRKHPLIDILHHDTEC